MKKALIFDPYLDTLGGGERYALTFAQVISKLGYAVDLAWKNEADLVEAQRRFGLDLSRVELNQKAWHLCASHSSLPKRFQFTGKYDLIFWVSDGSLPFLFGKNNLVHFQVPFTIPFNRMGGNPLLKNLKLLFINKLVYNSNFTKQVLERSFPPSKAFVLYPPIDTDQFKPGEKENIILSVARFASPSHSKRQDVLIKAFKLFSKGNKDYRLVLAGGFTGEESVLSKLKNLAKGLKVDIVTNPSFDELKRLYAKARFFWHGAGFEVDEEGNPEKVEHFGMTTVEAMSAGAVPVVIAKGGQKEIVNKENGALVNTATEMANITQSFASDKDLLHDLSESSITASKQFSIDEFSKKIVELIG